MIGLVVIIPAAKKMLCEIITIPQKHILLSPCGIDVEWAGCFAHQPTVISRVGRKPLPTLQLTNYP